MHEQMLNRPPASPDPGSCRLGARATAALALLVVLALGVQIGLMIDIAGSEATQAHALAPTTDGGGAMAYCVVYGAVTGKGCDGQSTACYGHALATSELPAAVTRALGKGCTMVGGLILESADPGVTGMQPMLCPKALVGSTPADSHLNDGNTGQCVV